MFPDLRWEHSIQHSTQGDNTSTYTTKHIQEKFQKHQYELKSFKLVPKTQQHFTFMGSPGVHMQSKCPLIHPSKNRRPLLMKNHPLSYYGKFRIAFQERLQLLNKKYPYSFILIPMCFCYFVHHPCIFQLRKIYLIIVYIQQCIINKIIHFLYEKTQEYL